jgi:protein-S-isoprenylcysteine O-methyltransferase Ste14
MIPEIQNTIQLVTLTLMAAMGIGRAVVLKTRKIQVFVLDSQENFLNQTYGKSYMQYRSKVSRYLTIKRNVATKKGF